MPNNDEQIVVISLGTLRELGLSKLVNAKNSPSVHVNCYLQRLLQMAALSLLTIRDRIHEKRIATSMDPNQVIIVAQTSLVACMTLGISMGATARSAESERRPTMSPRNQFGG